MRAQRYFFTSQQISVVQYIGNKGRAGATSKECSEELGMSKSSCCHILRRLEDGGYISSSRKTKGRGRPAKIFVVKRLGRRVLSQTLNLRKKGGPAGVRA